MSEQLIEGTEESNEAPQETNETVAGNEDTPDVSAESDVDTDNPEATEEKQEEKKKAQSPALRTLARKEKKLQEQRQQFEEQKKEYDKAVQAVEDAKNNFSTDPVGFAKEVMGDLTKDDYLDIASFFYAESGALDNQPDHFIWKRIKEKKMETAQQRIERQQREWEEKQKQSQEEQLQKQQIAQYKNAVVGHINSKLEQLPYVNRIIEKKGQEFATETLWAWVEEQLNDGENRVTDPAFVAENFNTYLQQEAQSIREMFEDLFNTASEEAEDADSENTATISTDAQPGKSAAKPKTLNNKLTQQTNRKSGKDSWEERRNRAAEMLRAMNNQR